jgi:long-chain fatty acid transport protein
MSTKYVLPISGCLLLASWSSGAWATDAFNLIGHGPRSLALGGAGVAHDVGAAAMVLNPATLVLSPEGSSWAVGLDAISADIEVTNRETGERAKSHSRGRNNGPYFAPEISFTWHRDRLALGVGTFTSGGVGAQYGNDSFLSRTVTNDLDTGLGSHSRLISLRVPFSAAYRLTDKLTVGASLDAVWTSVNVGLLLDTTQIGALAAQGRLDGSLVPTLLSVPQLSAGYLQFDNQKIAGGEADAWGLGGRVGLTYEVSPQTRLGVTYDFETRVGDLKGNADLTAVSALLGNIPLSGMVQLRSFEFPAQLAVGISHQFNEKLSVVADYRRVFWSDVMQDIKVGFKQDDTGVTLDLRLPTNYRDTNVVSLGAEYQYNQKWTWRGGFHYAEQAAPDAGIIAVIPSTPTTNVTGGFSYALGERSDIEFAVGYGFSDRRTNDSLPNTSVPIEVKHSQIVAAVAYSRRY